MSSREGEREDYDAWMAQVPGAITSERAWKFYAYRKALYLYDLCWDDCTELTRHPLGRPVANQLIRSAGSISANIEEGYGRGWGKDRLYFLRVALGSARESKGWYWKSHHLLPRAVLDHRLALLDEVIALLVTEITRQKRRRS